MKNSKIDTVKKKYIKPILINLNNDKNRWPSCLSGSNAPASCDSGSSG